MTLTIVGGTYYEQCKDPIWNELYGSGLRAAHALSSRGTDISFNTFIGNDDYDNLSCICRAINVSLNAIEIIETSNFLYEYPLANPFFKIPEIDKNLANVIEGELVLQFGMIEGNPRVKAEKVVYDPQSPGNPISFWSNNSHTNELIWVANLQEMVRFTGTSNFLEIKKHLFEKENVYAAIIKKGSDGAILIQKNKEDFEIPVFKTNHVWPIGTGDIFTSTFAYGYLIENLTLEEASVKASLSTAYYTETSILPIPIYINELKFERFYKKDFSVKNVYLAGPFFNMAQRWLIEQFRTQLSNFGLHVFSPYHDIGFGTPETVVPLDIAAIKSADILVAIVDGLDSGTMFEIGYAKALNIPVIVFVEDECQESLTMIKGTDCLIENDFSTVIYKTIWEVYK